MVSGPKQRGGAKGETEVQALADGLRDAIGVLVRSVRAQAETPTTAQGETLAALERGGAVSIAALAKSRGVKHQSMRLVVAKLVDSGFLELITDPDDGRSYLVTLTKKGRAATAASRTARTQWLTDALTETMSTRELAVLRESIPLLLKIAHFK